ncbi:MULTISPECIES: nucleotide sugar dehydrogenase [Salinibaculum]|uniref:nucleotide sugar dehydrogenase n=1 Tax=Salinibaculum TaxID=2732368 RepID=UPI0030D310FF
MTSQSTGRPGHLYGSEADAETQRRAFRDGSVPVAVYGLGKMGLPLAAVYADVTGNAVGVDVDESVVRTVNEGGCHVPREPGLPELVADVVDGGALAATTDGDSAAERAAIHVAMVPTLLTDAREPDLSMLSAVAETVATGLSPGDLVVVESTVPPGTCRDLVVPTLEAGSDLSLGEFGVACCPERTLSGRALADIRGTHPKVVGGVDAESTRAAELVYGEITDNDVLTVSDAATAAAVKVFEGVYRDVNIALANQLALYARALDVDTNEAIEIANTQPFCDIHDPGPGVGGHCIPVYPYFLARQFDVDAPLLETARELNDRMASHTVEKLDAILDSEGVPTRDATVLLLGVTYRANAAELRNAPSVPIARQLQDRGATVLAVDPLVDDWDAFGDVEALSLAAARERPVDAVALLTPHDEFLELDWGAVDAPVLDGRSALDAETIPAPVYTIGGRWPTG